MVEVMVLKPTCLFAWDNPTGQQLSGAVYLSLGLACCGPAGKGLLESMPDLCLPDLLVLTEGLGQRSPPSKSLMVVLIGIATSTYHMPVSNAVYLFFKLQVDFIPHR